MLSVALLSMLLPTYSDGKFSNINEDIIFAQQLESTNPYTCINITEKILITDSINIDDRSANNKNETIGLSQQEKMYALNTLASCQIASNQIEEAKNILKIIFQIKPKNKQEEQIKILAEYNKERIKLIELPTLPKLSENNFSNQIHDFRGPLNIDELRYYSQLMNTNVHTYLGNYLTANKALDNFLSNKILEKPEAFHLKVNTLLSYAFFCQKMKANDKALQLLLQVYDLYDSKQYNYAKAIIAKEIASALFDLGYIHEAVNYQKISINFFEKEPKSLKQFVKELGTLTRYEATIKDNSNAYTMLLKAELLFNSIETSLLNKASIAKDLAYTCTNLNDINRAIKYYTISNNIYQSEKQISEYIYTSLNLSSLYIKQGQTNKAFKILNDIKTLNTEFNEEQKTQYTLVQTEYLANKHNYAQAYNNVKKLVENLNSKAFYYNNNEAISELNLSIKSNKKSNEKNSIETTTQNIIENIETENFIVKYATHITITMLVLILALLLFISSLKRKYLNIKEQLRHFEEVRSPLSDNSNENVFLSYLIKENFKNKINHPTDEPIIPQEKLIYHIYIPAFNEMALKLGNEKTKQNRRVLLDRLVNYIEENLGELFVITDSRFIIILNKNANEDVTDSCNNFSKKISELLLEIQENEIFSFGVVEYPFILNNTLKLNEQKLLEISLIALSGANELTIRNQTPSWVVLTAVQVSKNITFSGNMREATLEAFERNLLHYTTSTGDKDLDWNQILSN